MGKELFKKYSISNTPIMSTGFQSLWKVYPGYHKEKNQDVCIFFLDKKSLKPAHKSKSERKEIVALLKKDAANLMKYQSQNDSFLLIIEPLIEDKTSMGFITESFQSTLIKWCELASPSKLEIKLMIKEICIAISFLHNTHHVVHCNINPNNIFVTKYNKIKISGLCFAQTEGNIIKYNSQLITPNLNYASPEIIINHNAKYHSDTFSIGLLIHSLLKKYLNDKNKLFLNNPKDISSYKEQMDNYNNEISKLDFIEEDNEFLLKALNKEINCRPSIDEMLSMPWFNDPKLKSLYFLDNLDNNDYNKTKVFIEQLPNYISHYENRVIERRILPSLLKGLKKENFMSVIFPCIFTICELPMIKIKFEALIWPKIKELFQLKSLPSSTLYTLLSKIDFFGKKLSDKEFNDNFLNVIIKALDSNVSKIQTVIVDNLFYLITKFEHETFQSKLYPRLMSILTSTTSNDIKIKILYGIKEIYSWLDHNSINDSLLSALASINIMETSSEVCIGMGLVYEEIAKIASIETVANAIIPRLVTLLISGNITKGGFDLIMKMILTYLDRIKVFRENNLIEEKIELSLNNESRIGNSKIIMMETINDKEKDNDFFASFFNSNNDNYNLKEEVEGKIEFIKKLNSEKNKDFLLLTQNDLSFDELSEKKKNHSSLQLQASNKDNENILQLTEEDHFKLNQAKDNAKDKSSNNNNMSHNQSYNKDLMQLNDFNNILDHDSFDEDDDDANNNQQLSQGDK